MDTISIVLLVALLVVGGLAAWLFAERARLRAEVAASRAAGATQQAELERERAVAADRERRVEDLRTKHAALEQRATVLEGELVKAEEKHKAELERERAILDERLKGLEQRERAFKEDVERTREEMKRSFEALSAKALRETNEQFLQLAETKFKQQQGEATADLEKRREAIDQIVRPIRETLARADEKLAAMEKERTGAYARLVEQVQEMQRGNQAVRDEAGRLVQALRQPQVRGRYGEVQLKKVAELAGMSAYCDFEVQSSTIDSEGRALRPDMVVRLPNERVVVVDAKTNIHAYLEALEARTPEEAGACLDRFARHVGEQASALARKQYYAQYDGSPEFVVMFIPGDQFIDAALSRQPEILENAARQGVLLAGPATLIGLLRAVAVGYREEKLAKEAVEIRALGVEFHKRLAKALGDIVSLGKALNSATTHFNSFVGSYTGRLEPQIRKFEEAGVKSASDVPTLAEVEIRPRALEAAPRLDGAGEVR
ncbi:MAG: DNA recombination protein RmuC [Phycisphaerae bacterium]|nr:DNA recombination protein RmuC [Phycisphaerae bacterium]